MSQSGSEFRGKAIVGLTSVPDVVARIAASKREYAAAQQRRNYPHRLGEGGPLGSLTDCGGVDGYAVGYLGSCQWAVPLTSAPLFSFNDDMESEVLPLQEALDLRASLKAILNIPDWFEVKVFPDVKNAWSSRKLLDHYHDTLSQLAGIDSDSAARALTAAAHDGEAIEATPARGTTKTAYDAGTMRLAVPKRAWKDAPVSMVAGSMLDFAYAASAAGVRVAILNFANNYRPGLFDTDGQGRHFFHTRTQEEQLLIASLDAADHVVLPLDQYPITVYGGSPSALWSRNVLFHRDPRTGKPLHWTRRFTADMITCAALVRPRLVSPAADGLTCGPVYAAEDEAGTLERMLLVLSLAHASAPVFVTGLWGCGAFGHPIRASMQLWRRAILLAPRLPRRIVFCYMLDNLTNTSSHDQMVADMDAGLFEN